MEAILRRLNCTEAETGWISGQPHPFTGDPICYKLFVTGEVSHTTSMLKYDPLTAGVQ